MITFSLSLRQQKQGLVLCSFLFLYAAATAQPTPPDELEGLALRTWFKENWHSGIFDDLGYSGARTQMFGYVDANDGNIECVYTGFQQAASFTTFPDPINTEHLVPQSFFGSTGPLKSDLYNLQPAHGSANSARGNSAFAEVGDGSAQWYGIDADGNYMTQGDIPPNPDVWSERTGSLWEPREEKKGDIARSVFYAYTMYPGEAGPLDDLADPAVLLAWHQQDPVSPEESTRGERIVDVQMNANPYLQDSEYVIRAWFPDLIVDPPPPPQDTTGTCSIFFSEYGEGSGFNKHLEIFNPTDSVIGLDAFAIAHTTNAPSVPGMFETWLPFEVGAEIGPGEVYLIVHPQASPDLLQFADQTYGAMSNGDDGFGLVFGVPDDFDIVDIIGNWDGDPGSAWEVAGNGSTANATLIRKPEIHKGNAGNWASSAGTNADDSEWIVLNPDDFGDVGSHTSNAVNCNDGGPDNPFDVLGCTYSSACNFNAEANIDDLSCDFDSCLMGGCTYTEALNFSPEADFDNGSCEFPICQGDGCLTDLDGDSTTAVTDLLILLGAFGDVCPQ